jgi:hypothetical protein
VFSFIGAPPFTQFVPGKLDQATGVAEPVWDAELPFFAAPGRKPGARRVVAAANLAIVQFRKQVSAFITDLKKHSSRIRVMTTNWGGALALPRVIHL